MRAVAAARWICALKSNAEKNGRVDGLQTTDGRFKAGTVEAKRGLDEYLTLQEDLVAGHPDVIVPGLALAVLDDDHLLRLELNRFLTRIAAIEQLRQDPIAVAFLQGEEVRSCASWTDARAGSARRFFLTDAAAWDTRPCYCFSQRPGGKKTKTVLQLGTLSVPMVPLQLQQFKDLIPQKGVPESDLFYEEQRGTVARLDASYHNATRAADRVRKAHSGTPRPGPDEQHRDRAGWGGNRARMRNPD